MSVNNILDRLQRVKQVRPGTWKSACPCCESRKGYPLYVTETGDGRVLVHAFCGCETADVLGRIGLELQDLFDQPAVPAVRPTAVRVPAADVLDSLSHEVTVLAILIENFKLVIPEAQYERLGICAQRIGHARDYLHERSR